MRNIFLSILPLIFCCNVEPTVISSPSHTVERVAVVVYNKTDMAAQVCITVNEHKLLYPVRANDAYNINLKCADVFGLDFIRFVDGETIYLRQEILRELDYDCDDVILIEIHDNMYYLSVTRI